MTTQPTPPPAPGPDDYELPSGPPDPGAAFELAHWERLAESALPRSSAGAQTWRNGLAGFITLVASAAILKGPDVADMPGPWKQLTVVLVLGALCFAVCGLWIALSAESPPERITNRRAILDTYGSVTAYEQKVAEASSEKIALAKSAVLVSIVCLLAAIGCWSLSPGAAAEPSKMLVGTKTATGHELICGDVRGVVGGAVLVAVGEEPNPRPIPLTSVESMTLVGSCPK